MSDKETFKDPELFELSTWETLVRTDEWKYFVGLLKDHKDHCERQVLISVAKQDFHSAVRYEAKAEDTGKLLDLVDGRIKHLRKPKEVEK